MQALNEVAAVLKSVLAKEGSQLISFLQQKYFPSLPLGPEPSQAFCRALQEMELKMFRNYVKVSLSRPGNRDNRDPAWNLRNSETVYLNLVQIKSAT